MSLKWHRPIIHPPVASPINQPPPVYSSDCPPTIIQTPLSSLMTLLPITQPALSSQMITHPITQSLLFSGDTSLIQHTLFSSDTPPLGRCPDSALPSQMSLSPLYIFCNNCFKNMIIFSWPWNDDSIWIVAAKQLI